MSCGTTAARGTPPTCLPASHGAPARSQGFFGLASAALCKIIMQATYRPQADAVFCILFIARRASRTIKQQADQACLGSRWCSREAAQMRLRAPILSMHRYYTLKYTMHAPRTTAHCTRLHTGSRNQMHGGLHCMYIAGVAPGPKGLDF